MSRQTRRNNDAAALSRRRWVAPFNPEETMDEKACMRLALETADELDTNRPPGMKAAPTAGPMAGKLGDVLTWLRGQNVPWAKIFAMLPQVIAALSSGNWASVIALLIPLFGLPPTTAIPPPP